MIRVLVVEDEIPIQRNICNMIEKEDERFRVTHRVQNGEDAFEVLSESRDNIDLMFLDIHMPVMDGIELLQGLKDNNIDVPTIILSGYQDFNYVRESMRYGVIDYLLKPINKEMLRKVLREAEHNIIKKAYEKHMETGEELYKEYKVALVYFGSKYLSREKRSMGLLISETNKRIMYEFEQYIQRQLEENEFWIIKDNHEPEWFMIFKDKGGRLKRALQNFIESDLRNQGHLTILLDDELQSINTIYAKRLHMSEDIKVIMELGESCFYYGDIKPEYKVRKEELQILRKKIQKATLIEELSKVIKDTLCEVGRKSTDIVELLTFAIQHYSSRFSMNYSYDLVVEEIYQIVEESMAFEDLLNRVERLILRSFGNNDRKAKKRKLALDIKDYIDINYRENLSMDELAFQFGFVQDYIRSIFGREYGMTPMEYLQSIRLTETKRLLLENPNLSFKDIAVQVGYNDASYYSRVFKKSQGCSPSMFRKNNS